MTFLKLSLALIKNIGKGYVIPVESGRTGSFEKYCGEASVLAMGPSNFVYSIKRIRKDFAANFSQDHRNFVCLGQKISLIVQRTDDFNTNFSEPRLTRRFT